MPYGTYKNKELFSPSYCSLPCCRPVFGNLITGDFFSNQITMATIGQLYELARSPNDQALSKSAWYEISSIKPTLPDLSNEFKFVANCASAAVNHTSVKIDEHLPTKWKESYHTFEEVHVANLATLLGIDHVSPRSIIKFIIFFSLLSFCLVSYVLKIRRRRRHKMMYGNNAFPPYARAGMFTTINTIWTNSELPWFFKQCADDINSSVFRLRLPLKKNYPMIVAVGDVDTIKEILQDPGTMKSESFFASIASIAGGGPNILTSEGQQWKKSRKAISPAFLKRNLDRMHRICREETENWINNKLKRFIDKDKDFDVGREMVHLTLSILCKAAFDYEMKAKEKESIGKELKIISKEYSFNELHRPMKANFGILLSSGRRARLARTRLQDFAKKILHVYRKKKSLENSTAVSTDETIISCIVNSKKYDDDSRRVADIVMFLFSGVENTAYSLGWTLFELARSGNAQVTLRNALTGNDDVRAQEMLKDVLREGMRLHPQQVIGVRTVNRDFYMDKKSIVIPKGSHIFVPTLVLTRFGVDDSDKFLPSRWREHPDKSFLLFSTGRRSCVGQSLALAEITWVLSRLCAKYEFAVTSQSMHECNRTLKCVETRLKASVIKK